MVLIANERRRMAVIAVFVPLAAFWLIYVFRLRDFIPTMASWPTQQEIAVRLHRVLQHSLWPWAGKDQVASAEDKEYHADYDSEWFSFATLEGGSETSPIFDGPRVHTKSERKPFSRYIVAVGDLHGDLPNARRVLQFAGVTDQKGDWTGNVDFFVQTGDIIDRGDDTILLFTWMERLRVQAEAAGATVLSHLGNHEMMNAIGDWRYVYPSEIKTFGSVPSRQKMITTGRIGRAWATNYTIASRLPLHPALGPPNTPYPSPHPLHHGVRFEKEDQAVLNSESNHDHGHEHQHGHEAKHAQDVNEGTMSHVAISFMHGGLSPTYSGLAPFPEKINKIGSSLLAKLQHRAQPPPHPPNPYPGLPHDATPEEQEFYGVNGPLWYRGWATDPEPLVCQRAEEVLQKTGTRRMIMGHTPDFQNIKSRCNGKIIIIDTGISHAYGGVLSALSIYYTLVPVGEDSDKLWREREIITAIYPNKREILVKSERFLKGDFDHSKTGVRKDKR